MDTATIRADIAKALEAALTALPNVTVYAYWIDNASVPAVVIDDHEAHVDNRVRINTWIVRVILPDGAKEDAYRLGDDIITLLTPLTVDPHSLAVTTIIPTSTLVAQQNLPGYTLNLTDDRKALCGEKPTPPPAIPATGAVMGKPGYYTPVGSVPPTDAVALDDLAPSPATVWDPGTYVIVAAGTEHHWDGTAWVTGRAPTPPPPQLVLTVTDQTDLTVAVAITNEDPTGDPATVDWGDGDITADLDHTYADPGTYTLIAEQVGRTDSNPVDVTVTEPPPPPELVLAVTNQTDLTVTVTVSNHDPAGPTATVNWGDGATNALRSHTYAAAGTYTLLAEQPGRSDSEPVNVNVTEPPPVSILPTLTMTYYGYPGSGSDYLLGRIAPGRDALVVLFAPGHTPPAAITGFPGVAITGLTRAQLRSESVAFVIVTEPRTPEVGGGLEDVVVPIDTNGTNSDPAPDDVACWHLSMVSAWDATPELRASLADAGHATLHTYPPQTLIT